MTTNRLDSIAVHFSQRAAIGCCKIIGGPTNGVPMVLAHCKACLDRHIALESEHISKVTYLIGLTVERWGQDPKDINSGRCFEFAKVIFDQVVGAKIAGNNLCGQGHSFIEHEGLFYDAEEPMGTPNWTRLPFFERALRAGKAEPAALCAELPPLPQPVCVAGPPAPPQEPRDDVSVYAVPPNRYKEPLS